MFGSDFSPSSRRMISHCQLNEVHWVTIPYLRCSVHWLKPEQYHELCMRSLTAIDSPLRCRSYKNMPYRTTLFRNVSKDGICMTVLLSVSSRYSLLYSTNMLSSPESNTGWQVPPTISVRIMQVAYNQFLLSLPAEHMGSLFAQKSCFAFRSNLVSARERKPGTILPPS